MAQQTSLFSERCVLSSGIRAATVVIENGKIAAVFPRQKKVIGQFHDFGNSLIMSGIIDVHVHLNEPGRTHWEGFATGTKAALAGGITTIVDMPLNSTPVTTTATALQKKQIAAKQNALINCKFWGGLIPENHNDLEALLEAGALGLKAFLVHSGIDDFPNATEADLRKAMPILAKHDKPLLVHCEVDLEEDYGQALRENPKSYQAYLGSRPKEMENKAIAMLIRLCREYRCRCHIVHLASEEALQMIAAAKAEGLPLTVETCAHYLIFTAEQISDGETQFKCAPPIRTYYTREALWKGLKDGLIDFITTDHSPAPPELKSLEEGNFIEAWGGIAGLQFLLPAVWTAARNRDIPLEKIAVWLSEKPAVFIGLQDSKGKIEIGFDADLVVWQPDASFTVTKDIIEHKHKVSPYEGMELFGVTEAVFLAGVKI